MDIKFQGEISNQSKNYIIKQVDKNYRWGMTGFPVMFLLLGAPIIAVGYKILGVLVTALLFVVFVVISFVPRIHYNPKGLEKYYPNRIIVENNHIITDGIAEDAYSDRKISEVKIVIDCGDFYYVKYYFPFYMFTLCQKDLIVQGTIEEFEEIFKDKIVRKTK